VCGWVGVGDERREGVECWRENNFLSHPAIWPVDQYGGAEYERMQNCEKCASFMFYEILRCIPDQD
jgi:hypothetical protein